MAHTPLASGAITILGHLPRALDMPEELLTVPAVPPTTYPLRRISSSAPTATMGMPQGRQPQTLPRSLCMPPWPVCSRPTKSCGGCCPGTGRGHLHVITAPSRIPSQLWCTARTARPTCARDATSLCTPHVVFLSCVNNMLASAEMCFCMLHCTCGALDFYAPPTSSYALQGC